MTNVPANYCQPPENPPPTTLPTHPVHDTQIHPPTHIPTDPLYCYYHHNPHLWPLPEKQTLSFHIFYFTFFSTELSQLNIDDRFPSLTTLTTWTNPLQCTVSHILKPHTSDRKWRTPHSHSPSPHGRHFRLICKTYLIATSCAATTKLNPTNSSPDINNDIRCYPRRKQSIAGRWPEAQ